MKFVQYSNVSSTNLQRLEVLQDPARVLPGLRGSPPTRDPAGVRLPQERGPRRAQGAPRAQDHRQRVHVLGGGEADRGHEEDFALGDPSQGGGQTVRGRYAIFIEYFIEFWYRVVHQIVQGDSPP